MITSVPSFQDCRDWARDLPFGCATDEAIRWLRQYEFIDAITLGNPVSKKHSIQRVIARIVVALSLPSISLVGVYYSLAAGSIRFVTGSISHIKTPKERVEIGKEFEAAFTHFGSAVYDFALGYLISMHHIGTIAALCLGIFSTQAVKGHRYLFAKAADPGDDATTPKHHELNPECLIAKTAKQLAESLVPKQEPNTPSMLQRAITLLSPKKPKQSPAANPPAASTT